MTSIDMPNDRLALAQAWQSRSRVTRQAVFGDSVALMPNKNREDARTAAPGMVGHEYRPAGVLLLSVNPAGGKDNYQPTSPDIAMYDAFRTLAAAPPAAELQAFEAVNEIFMREMPRWTVYRQHIAPVMSALGITLSELAYAYVVPFRITDDAAAAIKPAMVESAWRSGLEAQVLALDPSTIIAIDRKAETCARRYAAVAKRPVNVWYYTRKRDAHAERRATLEAMCSASITMSGWASIRMSACG